MIVFDTHTAHEIVGIDGDAFGIGRLVGDRLVAHAAQKTVVVDNDMHIGRDKQLHPAHKGVDFYFHVPVNERLAEIHADASAEGLEFAAQEWLAPIAIGIT